MNHWEGLKIVNEIVSRRGLEEAIEKWGLPETASNSGYAPVDTVMSFMVRLKDRLKNSLKFTERSDR